MGTHRRPAGPRVAEGRALGLRTRATSATFPTARPVTPPQGFGASSPWRPAWAPQTSPVHTPLRPLPGLGIKHSLSAAHPHGVPWAQAPSAASPQPQGLSTEHGRTARLPARPRWDSACGHGRDTGTRPPDRTHSASQKPAPTPGGAQQALQSASRGLIVPSPPGGPPQARGVPARPPPNRRLLSGTCACSPAQVPAVTRCPTPQETQDLSARSPGPPGLQGHLGSSQLGDPAGLTLSSPSLSLSHCGEREGS